MRAPAAINKATIIGVIRHQGCEYRIGFLPAARPQKGTANQRAYRAFRICIKPIQQQHAGQPFTHLGLHAKGLRQVPRIELGEDKAPNLWCASGQKLIHLVQGKAADIGNLPMPSKAQAKLQLIIIQNDFA